MEPAVPQSVLDLVARFEAHHDAYHAPEYNEAQVRREFIDPLFKALGWDVENAQGYAEQWKEVVHEDALKVGGATKAPDYSFRLGGRRLFFLEAKRPATDIKEDAASAYQLRRYGWTANLPVSILTDFEELAVYDTRVRPSASDRASAARVLYMRYDEYAARWAEIAGLFSPDAIRKGAFDKYVASLARKRGTAEVDDAFLAEIEEWREALAENVALRNPALTQRELNYAVQATLDRIIFLRIAEDRGIEPYGRLQALLNGENVYLRLRELYDRADERYNSGLFHFRPERDRAGAPDVITPRLAVDDKPLKDILRRLYYPDCPYEFSVFPAEILGHVYERFLGSVIRLTEGNRAKVEQKPEVRKAGGVFYTPAYIVNYIVQETVGRFLEGKTPADVAGMTLAGRPAKDRRPLAVLDPACGSGSFLLGAYQCLLDWYLARYAEDAERWARGATPKIHPTPTGGWRLTTPERKRILLDHIHGVDIDPQAVEVTKLSLLLKVLEGENAETLQKQLRLFHERALPDLAGNIKCGNSLIGPEFYHGRQRNLFDEEEVYRVNAFDWAAEFPAVMKSGGFDAVVGNPPYIRIQTMKEWAPAEVAFYKGKYRAAKRGNYDIYVIFAEKGLGLLNPSGELGMILPHKFFNSEYGEPLRTLISEGRHLRHVVHFGAEQVFAGATTYTCLLFLSKGGSRRCRFHAVRDLKAWAEDPRKGFERGEIEAERINGIAWNIHVGKGRDLARKLGDMTPRLGDAADIFVGLQTSADDVFILDLVKEGARTLRLRSRIGPAEVTLEKGLLHPLLSGADVHGYNPLPSRQFILFPYEVKDGKASLIPFADIQTRWPRTAAYLQEHRRRLVRRERGQFRGKEWYRLGRTQNLGIQDRPKVCVPRLVDRLCACLDAKGTHFLDNVDVGGVTFKPAFASHSLAYLCGLLNSRLLAWYFPKVSAPFRGGWMSANRQFLSQVPFRAIDFNDRGDAARHERMASLVTHVLALRARLASARTGHEQDLLRRQADSATQEIDDMVYVLYGLTQDEIAIVEEECPAS